MSELEDQLRESVADAMELRRRSRDGKSPRASTKKSVDAAMSAKLEAAIDDGTITEIMKETLEGAGIKPEPPLVEEEGPQERDQAVEEVADTMLACAGFRRPDKDGANQEKVPVYGGDGGKVAQRCRDKFGFTVEDSGKRQSFSTGAVRDTQDDKPRPDLVSPFFLWRLGEHMRKGAIKYSANNWAKGIPNSRCLASAIRHLTEYQMGMRNEDHLAAAAFNIMAMIHNEEVSKQGVTLNDDGEGLVDVPYYTRGDEE